MNKFEGITVVHLENSDYTDNKLSADAERETVTADIVIDGGRVVKNRMDNIPDNICTRIRELRKDRMLTQAELAKSVDVQPNLVTMWESNTTEPRAKHIMPLANALKCDPMWLLTGHPVDVKPAPLPAPNVMKGADLANIGVRIESRRNYIEMSLNKLAEEIDTSGAMIREWETGKAIPHSDYIDKLAKALNTTVTWLMTGKHITA